MPEGPEVAVVRDYLRYWLMGNQILSWSSARPLATVEFPLTVERVESVGKNLAIVTSAGILACHLRMEGRWNDGLELTEDKHRLMTLVVGRHDTFLTYLMLSDTRHFATLEWLTPRAWRERCQRLGPDVLQAGMFYAGLQTTLYETQLLTPDLWRQILAKRSKMVVGSFLNNQDHLAGIGNYLRAEILYRARISPWRKVGQLSSLEQDRLYVEMLNFIVASYRGQGKSLYTFEVPKSIRHEYTKDVPLYVYGKKTDPEGRPVETKKLGQMMHWVPSWQI